MSIESEFSFKTGYVIFRCRGTYELASVLDLYGKAIEAAAQKGLPALLIDVREITGTPPTTLDRFTIGEYVATHGQEVKFALVGHEPMIDPRRFGEIVAANRGATVKAFTDLDEAVAWLTQSHAPDNPPTRS
jgi:hypothetical protein